MQSFSNITRPQSPTSATQIPISIPAHYRPASPPSSPRQSPSPYNGPSSHPTLPILYHPIPNNRGRENFRIPAAYNAGNIYYNRPGQGRRVQWSYSRSGSWRTGSRSGDGRRMVSPLEVRNLGGNPRPNVKARVNIRYVSPPPIPPSYTYIPSQSNPKIQQPPQAFLNSQTSMFTFGQPKKPEILTRKKPGIKRMNSQTSEPGSEGYKIYVHYDNEQRSGPAPVSPKQTQIFSIYNNKPLPSSSPSPSPDPQTLPHTSDTQTYSMQLVNSTPVKRDAENSAMNMEKVDDHIYEEEHKIAKLLAEELQLNYDYFRGGESSDRSISDYVQL